MNLTPCFGILAILMGKHADYFSSDAVMMGLLVKVGEDALPVLQQRLHENQRRG